MVMRTQSAAQQNIKPGLMWWGVLLLCGIFMISGQARAEEVWDEAAIEAARALPCKGLKPFNNIDELLYQFYINLDSDCLFNMSVAELEEVWGTKIYQIDRAEWDKDYVKYVAERPELFWKKPYNSEKDAFWVGVDSTKGREEGQLYFRISITRAYRKKYCTLFPEGSYPKLLPPPSEAHHMLRMERSAERGWKPSCTPVEIQEKYPPTSRMDMWYRGWAHPATIQLGKPPRHRISMTVTLGEVLEEVTTIVVR